ncbi:hypothetical protein F5148DRAFT_195371 [Russula earlei]|uniref:Uncharacterized protein n=1 Tax=Russula earlei TaxID=71964 RepID=A0ACC0TR28_9AGAM|nr:hypothetical protein F5148DRAFT_195371 [Russula earlei]
MYRRHTLKEHLQKYAPPVRHARCELSPVSTDAGGSGVEVPFAKVATLSEEVFHALRGDKGIPRSTSTNKAASKGLLPTKRNAGQEQAGTQTQSPSTQSLVFSYSTNLNFDLADLAYVKLILHAFRYPTYPVYGFLLGPAPTTGAPIEIVDAVPLYCSFNYPSRSLEDAFELVTHHASSRQLWVVGYYEAPVGEAFIYIADKYIVTKINEKFRALVALVFNREKLLDESGAALVSYAPIMPYSTTFSRLDGKLNFNRAVPDRAQHLILHNTPDIWDYSDYLRDNSAPFLTNDAVRAALRSLQ